MDYGYAATIHKSQGVTVDQTFILASPYLDRHATYVAMTRHSDHAELFWSKEAFPSYEAMVDTLSRDRSKEFSLDYTVEEFALHRGIESEALLTFESYHQKLNSKEDFVLDWAAMRRDVEENNPELAREMTQHVTEDPRLDLALENKPDDDKPDWYHDLFKGLDKKDESKDDFLRQLFYGREDELAKIEREPLGRDISDDHEIEL